MTVSDLVTAMELAAKESVAFAYPTPREPEPTAEGMLRRILANQALLMQATIIRVHEKGSP